MQELESFSILDVPNLMLSSVAPVVSGAEKSGIRVDWLDRVISETYTRRNHSVLAQ